MSTKTRPSALLSALIILATFGHCFPAACPTGDLQVETDSGILDGFVDPSAPNVRQFLGIPYAHPPVGSRRWLPASRLQSKASVNATNIGPACPQIPNGGPDDRSVYSPWGGNETEFFPLPRFDEDCLTLNVWAPQNPKKGLPVIVWFFGGHFLHGGTSSGYYNPLSWVQRTQEHIVITVNFRSNIFGFPNAAGLAEQNLGLLDQRTALEWVRDNVFRFGGDPFKMVSWGESSGAIALDYHNFAFPLDPIVRGMILDSGSAFFPEMGAQSFDTAHTNFSTVAAALGCGLAASHIDCLREASWQDIEAVLNANSTLEFLPIADDRIVFLNYTRRYEIGALSTVPMIIGTNQHEFNEGIPTPLGPTFNQSASDAATDYAFLCTAAVTSQLRQAQSRKTFRYRYDGNFLNISPHGYAGAFHTSELPMIFGTAGDFHGASTAYEDTVSRKMQDLWLKFAKDPAHGLSKAGWSSYGKGKAVVLGEARAPVRLVNISQIDGVCNGSK